MRVRARALIAILCALLFVACGGLERYGFSRALAGSPTPQWSATPSSAPPDTPRPGTPTPPPPPPSYTPGSLVPSISPPPPSAPTVPFTPQPRPSARPAGPTPTLPALPSSQWVASVGTTVCGGVRAYRAPTATIAGILQVGSRSYTLAPGERPHGVVDLAIGGRACVWGGIDAPFTGESGADVLFGPRCGRVRGVVPPTPNGFGRIDIVEYWSLGALSVDIRDAQALSRMPPVDAYVCLALDVDQATGDAFLVGFVDTLADVELACGVVKSFAPPTVSADGSITIGTRTIAIPAGLTYRGDPAGARSDTTTVGEVMCFNALLDDQGRIVRYGPHSRFGAPGPNGTTVAMCGRVALFVPPSAGSDGRIAFSLHSDVMRIPAGAPIATPPPCVERRVAPNGDLIAPAGKTPEPVRL